MYNKHGRFLLTLLLTLTVSAVLTGCRSIREEPNNDKTETDSETENYSEVEVQNEMQTQTEAIQEKMPAPVTAYGRPEENADIMQPKYKYSLAASHPVDGRQGIACYDGFYYVSGSTTLSKYDADWQLTGSAEDPFEGFDAEVNHIGDIDVYDGEIYAGVEYFMDGEAKNIQVAVYDAQTFKLNRTYAFAEESGQTEVSGIAVDPDSKSIWMCSWADGESGRYLYRYDLETGEYRGRLHLQAPPQWIQGIAYLDGFIYISADDGTADDGEPDHIYRCKADTSGTAATVVLERTLDDVTLQGEIEGISFDRTQKQMLVSYNRGARIVLGMPRGFYEGYDSEIHEVFVYDMTENEQAGPELLDEEDGESEKEGWLYLEKP